MTSFSKSTTTASGDDTRESGTSGRPLSPTCIMNNSDTAKIARILNNHDFSKATA
jgi:hypothetical protein